MDEYVIESEKRTRFFQSIGFRIADGISKAVSTLTADEIAFKKERGGVSLSYFNLINMEGKKCQM